MNRLSLLVMPLFLLVFSACKDDEDPLVPAHYIQSHEGIVIELDWSTGGSPSQALHESDLDLYLDLGNSNVLASENISFFEDLHLRDVFKDGTYSLYIGAIDVSRQTSYTIYISAPGGQVVHRYVGLLMPGEEGEIHYLNIRKEGPRYTLVDL